MILAAISVVGERYARRQRLFCFPSILRYDYVSEQEQQIGNSLRIASRFTVEKSVLIPTGRPFLEEAALFCTTRCSLPLPEGAPSPKGWYYGNNRYTRRALL
jgi:hypothetical protein